MVSTGLSSLSVLLLALAAFTLGQALQVNNGFFHGRAILWLALSLLIMGAAAVTARSKRAPFEVARLLPWTLLAVILFQLGQLWSKPPLLYSPLRHGRDDLALALSIAATAALAFAIAVAGPKVRALAFAGILGAQLAAGVRVVQLVPEPQIDVVTVQEAAVDAISRGESPYGITFRNIYGSSTRFYGEGMASETDVHFGFPYPPLALAFVAPAHWLLGDYRYGIVAALALVALVLASFGWTRDAMLAASVLVTTPRVLFEIEQGWTEPFVILMLTLVVWTLQRHPAQSPILIGMGMAVKQYLVIPLLLLPLMPRVNARRAIVAAIAVAAIITLPFALWDWSGFMKSVVWLQLREPFRLDSLSFLVWFARRGMQPPTVAITLVAVVVAAAFALRALPSSPGAVAAGVALISIAAFAFGKKAFCNYYFFVIGALVTAIAASSAGQGGGVSDADSR